MARIYLSSTFQDLKSHRQAVIDALVRMDHHITAMEYYTADTKCSPNKCIEDVKASDLYIGIFAMRYGYIPEGYNISITELELKAAIENNIPRLIFILQEDASWPLNLIEYDMRGEINRLKEELKKSAFDYFNTPDNLAMKVSTSVTNWAAERGIIGEEDRADWEKYRYNILNLHQWIPLSVIASREDDLNARIPLTEIFVSQLAVKGTPTYEISDYILEQRRETFSLHTPSFDFPNQDIDNEDEDSIDLTVSTPILDSIGTEKRQVILGGPGTGKSTLLIYILLCLCGLEDQYNKFLNKFNRSTIGFIIELRKYVLSNEADFISYVCNYVKDSYGIDVPYETLNQLFLAEDRALVMFDGLDEVFESSQRERVIKQFRAFSINYPNVNLIVTSRIVGYEKQELELADFQHYTLTDFSIQQIKQFIPKWYEHYTLEGTQKDAQGLVSRIEESPRLLELAGNPLLLTMMAVIYKTRDLPEQRWRLYENATDLLLERWDVRKNLGSTLNIFITAEQKEAVLQNISKYMLEKGQKGRELNAISHEPLIDILVSYLVDEYGMSGGAAQAASKNILGHLRERTYILAEIGERIYGFVHRTFMEFFAARKIIKEFNERKTDLEWLKSEIFIPYWHRDDWQEVLFLFVAMLGGRSFPVDDIIKCLLDDCKVEPLPSNLLFAACCLTEAKHYDDPSIGQRVLKELAEAIIERCQKLSASKIETDEFVESALNNFTELAPLVADTSNISSLILRFYSAQLPQRSVAWQMKFALKPKAERFKFASKTLNHGDSAEQIGAVNAIVREWPGKDFAREACFNALLQIRSNPVRQAILLGLQRSWSPDRRIADFIINSVQDFTPSFIAGAMEYLGTAWAGDLQMLEHILQLCGHKVNSSNNRYDTLHQTALSLIISGWQDNHDTPSVLESFILNNGNEMGQTVALRALCYGWPHYFGLDRIIYDIIKYGEYVKLKRTAILILAGLKTNKIYSKQTANRSLRYLNAPDMPTSNRNESFFLDLNMLDLLSDISTSVSEDVEVRLASLQAINIWSREIRNSKEILKSTYFDSNNILLRISSLLMLTGYRYLDKLSPRFILNISNLPESHIIPISNYKIDNSWLYSSWDLVSDAINDSDPFLRSLGVQLTLLKGTYHEFDFKKATSLLDTKHDLTIRLSTIYSFGIYLHNSKLKGQDIYGFSPNVFLNNLLKVVMNIFLNEQSDLIVTAVIYIFSENITEQKVEIDFTSKRGTAESYQVVSGLKVVTEWWLRSQEPVGKLIELARSGREVYLRQAAITALLLGWYNRTDIIRLINEILGREPDLISKEIKERMAALKGKGGSGHTWFRRR